MGKLRQKRGIWSSSLLLGGLLAISLGFFGCATNKDLDRITREQAATIESLNHEITRLNEELEQTLRSREDLAKAKAALERKMQEELEAGDMSVSMQDRGLVVTLLNRILFDSGKADLKETSLETLNKMVQVLEQKVGENMVYVEGHTDNIPIRYSGWRSNWELSTARATEVIHYFVEVKIDPKRLAAIGYGEHQPVASNETEDGRMQNRRVEIVISPKKISSSEVASDT